MACHFTRRPGNPMESEHEGTVGENAVSSRTSHRYSHRRWWVEHGHGCHGRQAQDMGHQVNLQVSGRK